MIIRVFRGCVRPERLGLLDQLLADVTTPLLKAQKGLRSHHIGRPMLPHENEFVVVTVWEDLQALQKFSGEHWQQAVVPPQMAAIIEDSFLYHYSSFEV